jgi:hypothetical protein
MKITYRDAVDDDGKKRIESTINKLGSLFFLGIEQAYVYSYPGCESIILELSDKSTVTLSARESEGDPSRLEIELETSR